MLARGGTAPAFLSPGVASVNLCHGHSVGSMAHAVKAAPELGCIFVRWAGRFDADELAHVLAGLGTHPCFHTGASVFHDARQWDLDLPTAELLRVTGSSVTRPARFSGTRRGAFVVSDSLAYGMLRVLATLRERPDLRVEVFRDLGEAKIWLGLGALPGDPFEGMTPR